MSASDIPPPKSSRGLIGPILVATAAVEIPTLIARFGLGLESTRDTASTVGRLTFGLRIHHGYIGLLLLLLVFFRPGFPEPWRRRTLILGAALFISDLLHHFLFLWVITGSPQFDFWYPQ
jgi:hypothetical protein